MKTLVLFIGLFLSFNFYANAQICPNTMSSTVQDLGALCGSSYTPAGGTQAFPGCLYDTSNTAAPAAADSTLRELAYAMTPLDAFGNPSPTGKIVIVAIGFSNWTDEICSSNNKIMPCQAGTFITDFGTTQSYGTVNKNIVILDLAQSGQTTDKWNPYNPAVIPWSIANSRLNSYNITKAQVQIILFKNAEVNPCGGTIPAHMRQSLAQLQHPWCQVSDVGIGGIGGIEDCYDEQEMGIDFRLFMTQFPNTKQIFLHTRTAAHWTTAPLNPEPFAYEYGYANKHIISAQYNQLFNNGSADPVAGDLSHVALLAWGPYFWANGNTNNYLGFNWPITNTQTDRTHPSPAGINFIGNLMMDFYESSPYSAPYFCASGVPCGVYP